jgi:energy-coupling factor transporter ATP-binding protein EcfA2
LIHLSFALPPLGRDDIIRLIEGVCNDPEVTQLSELFATGLPPNPRSVKRTLQMFLFMRDLARTGEKEELRTPLLAKLIIIQQRCRDLYRELYVSPEILGEIETIARRSPTDAEPSIDPARRERIDRHLTQYPLLSELLRHGDQDLFANSLIEPYLSLLRSVPEGRGRNNGSARQSLRDLVAARISASRPTTDFLMPFRLRGPDEVLVVDPSNPDVNALFRRANQVLLIGSPGSGKTTLIMMLARAMVEQRPKDESSRRLPLYIAVRGLRPSVISGTDWVFNAALNTDSVTEVGGSLELARLLLDGRCCVMFDGFDEAVPAQRASIEAAISSFATTYSANQIIVSTREIDARLELSFASWTLLPPTEADIDEIFRRRFGDDAEATLSKVRENFGELPQNPLFLNVIMSNLDLSTSPNLSLTVREAINRLVARIALDPSGLSPDVARLLLRRMVSADGRRVSMSENEILRLGRDMGLTDVQTLAYLSAISNIGIIRQDDGGYWLAHDVIARSFMFDE